MDTTVSIVDDKNATTINLPASSISVFKNVSTKELCLQLIKHHINGVILTTTGKTITDDLEMIPAQIRGVYDIILFDFKVGFPYLLFWISGSLSRPINVIECKDIYISGKGIHKIFADPSLSSYPIGELIPALCSNMNIKKVGYIPSLFNAPKYIVSPLLWTIVIFSLIVIILYNTLTYLFSPSKMPS